MKPMWGTASCFCYSAIDLKYAIEQFKSSRSTTTSEVPNSQPSPQVWASESIGTGKPHDACEAAHNVFQSLQREEKFTQIAQKLYFESAQ